MGKTHFTLNRRVNLGFIVVWGLGAALLIILGRPRPLLTVVIGAVSGLAAGLLQRGSMRSSPSLFAEAQSALDVRRAFMSNVPGKLSVALLWVTGLSLIVVGVAGPGAPLVAFSAGYFSFMFVREVTTFSAVRTIDQGARDSQHAF